MCGSFQSPTTSLTSPIPFLDSQQIYGSFQPPTASWTSPIPFLDNQPHTGAAPISQTYPTSSPALTSSPGQQRQELETSGVGNEPRVDTTPVAPAPIDSPPLCPEQSALVDLIVAGHNVFYTGSAGCGKSTVLRAFVEKLRSMGKRVRIVAPTGRAALDINGCTTWTYAGLSPDSHKMRLTTLMERAESSERIRSRFIETDVLVIDEISMVENLHLERLNWVMRAGRGWYSPELRGKPFGDVQLVFTGDFCQLPPVKPFQHCLHCGHELMPSSDGHTFTCPSNSNHSWREDDKWAFRSKAWKEAKFRHVHLRTIHRQRDECFIRMLQKCRLGIPFTHDETEQLMASSKPGKPKIANAVRLYSTRNEVRRVNAEQFAKLKTVPHNYPCLDTFVGPDTDFRGRRCADGTLSLFQDHRFDREVKLKKGMLVILLVNTDLSLGLCNGSQGIICGFEPYDAAKLPKVKSREGTDVSSSSAPIGGDHAMLREQEIYRFANRPNAFRNGKPQWPVVRFNSGMTRPIYPECQTNSLGNDTEDQRGVLLCRTQIPLAPAWAMSIHKSQGMTLNRVIVDLSRAFEEGQVYVALSRATSLEGLRVEGSAKGLSAGKGGNATVRGFLSEMFGSLA